MYPVYIFYFLTAIVIILIVFKTILYAGSTHKRNVSTWFFFNNNAMYNSRSARSRKLKLLQNKLSLVILIFMAIDLIAVLLFNKLN